MSATLGIDLASKPKNTAVAVIEWQPGRAVLAELASGFQGGETLWDKRLVSAIRGLVFESAPPTKVGIDAPFGWPEPFVQAVLAHQHGDGWPDLIDNPRAKYERRTTDLRVWKETGKQPLSVSTDRIAYAAMRCAVLLGDLSRHVGREGVSRDGSGLVAEVYPDPALRHWVPDVWAEAPKDSYKGPGADARRRREALFAGLLRAASGRLEITPAYAEACVANDDCLDAVVCALVARAAELRATECPEGEETVALARLEGWIHIPTEPLAHLFGSGVG